MFQTRLFASACLATLLAWVLACQAGPVRIQGAGGGFSLPVKSLKEQKWERVVRQQYDFSCGSAAVATLLTFHYNMPVREETVFTAMFNNGDQARIQQSGFSMLDMKALLDANGLHSDGFQMALGEFAKLGVPGITMINTNGYNHFVVVKGVERDRVLVGDPALGTRVIPRQQFESQWNGVVLAARTHVQTARAHFNDEQEWAMYPEAPAGKGVDRSGLGMFTLTIPGRQEFGK